jgi:prolyl-tRNA editing enzyme YbaK/EbsC (Cys-tRNA(Pro) deacylase)
LTATHRTRIRRGASADRPRQLETFDAGGNARPGGRITHAILVESRLSELHAAREGANHVSALMDYLQGRGVTFVVIPHEDGVPQNIGPTTFSSDDVVKTVVLVTTLGHALCVIPDDRELELDLARAAVRDAEARPATAAELERSFPDYESGAVPPLGLLFLAPMYVDPAVIIKSSVVFRAGRHTVSIAMSTKALFRDDPVVITPLTRRTADAEADVRRLPPR